MNSVVKPRLSSLRLFGFVLVMLGGIAAVAFFTFDPKSALLHEWVQQLDELPETELRARLVQISELGDDGIPPLVLVLGSQRETCVLTAEWLLHRAIDDWKRLEPAAAASNVIRLSDLLATAVADLGPLGRASASSLATDLLLWPLVDHPRAGELVNNCDTVFRAADDSPRVRPTAATGESREASSSDAAASDRRLEANVPEIRSPLVAQLPGGSLPIDPIQIPTRAIGLARWPGPSPGPRGDEPALLPTPVNPQPELFLPSPAMQLPSPDVEPLPFDQSPPRSPDKLDQLEDRELMQLLADSKHGDTAEIELRRRGFGDLMIEMSRRTMDPDPRVRAELADALPRLPTDARPWLMLLAEDPHPQVRMSAYRWMLTSRDRQLHEFVRRAEQEDDDPENRRLLRTWFERIGK